MGYDFEIHYKPGTSNRVADALSRKTVGDVECGAIVVVQGVDWAELEKEITDDPFLTHIKEELQEGITPPHFSSVNGDGKLLFKGKVCYSQQLDFYSKIVI